MYVMRGCQTGDVSDERCLIGVCDERVSNRCM